MNGTGHISVHTLRRVRAGELDVTEVQAIRAHAEVCGECSAKERSLDAEAQDFARHISFDRFASGVERAARRPRETQLPRAVMALAASLLVVFGATLVLRAQDDSRGGFNNLKGGAQISLQIASRDGSQRTGLSNTIEALAPGDRVAIGYQADGLRFITALSIDERGEVTPLYPESGFSMRAEGGAGMQYLPDSLEFTGSGTERVIVLLSDEPLSMIALIDAARRAYEKTGGDLGLLSHLDVPGEQFHRTLLKP